MLIINNGNNNNIIIINVDSNNKYINVTLYLHLFSVIQILHNFF